MVDAELLNTSQWLHGAIGFYTKIKKDNKTYGYPEFAYAFTLHSFWVQILLNIGKISMALDRWWVRI